MPMRKIENPTEEIKDEAENEDKVEETFRRQREIKEEVVKIAEGSEKLQSGLEAIFPGEMEDKNFTNIVAAKVHSEVINNGMDESKAKELFGKIMEKVDEYNNALERKAEYNNLNKDYSYLSE